MAGRDLAKSSTFWYRPQVLGCRHPQRRGIRQASFSIRGPSKGLSANFTDEEILTRLVALNRERANEEARGLIRWLRPEYQNPAGHAGVATGTGLLALGETATGTARAPWPKALPEQIAAVRAALIALGTATPDEVARRFTRAQGRSLQPLLDSLAALGQARAVEGAIARPEGQRGRAGVQQDRGFAGRQQVVVVKLAQCTRIARRQDRAGFLGDGCRHLGVLRSSGASQ